MIGIGDQYLTGIIDNSPNLRSDPSSAKHYNSHLTTNYIGTDVTPIQPVMVQSGSWEGMNYTYTYTVRTNVGTLVVTAAPSSNSFPATIAVDTEPSNEDPGDKNNYYPSSDTPIGLEFSDGEDSGPSFDISLGYDATSITTPTVNITTTNGAHQTITDKIEYLTHTWNGNKVTETAP